MENRIQTTERRSGRTTKMVLEALEKQSKTGGPVLIVMSSEAQCKWVKDHFHHLIEEMEYISIRNLTNDKTKGKSVFIDHHALGY